MLLATYLTVATQQYSDPGVIPRSANLYLLNGCSNIYCDIHYVCEQRTGMCYILTIFLVRIAFFS